MKAKTSLPSDKDRIAAKRAYYEGLERGDIRPDRWADVPRSLAKVRDMDRPDLGLFKIGHRNHFVATHHLYGEDVAAIQGVIDWLNTKYPLPSKIKFKKPKKADEYRVQAAKTAERDFRATEIEIATQFHIYRQKAQLLESDYERAKIDKARLEEKVSELSAEITRLRNQLLRGI